MASDADHLERMLFYALDAETIYSQNWDESDYRYIVKEYALAFCMEQAGEPVSKLDDVLKSDLSFVPWRNLIQSSTDSAHKYLIFSHETALRALRGEFSNIPSDIAVYIGQSLTRLDEEAVRRLEHIACWLENAQFVATDDWDSVDYRNQLYWWSLYKALELVTKEAGDITDEFVRENSEMEWRKIAGLRSIVRHDVSEIDNDIIVDIVETRLPSLIDYLKKLSK